MEQEAVPVEVNPTDQEEANQMEQQEIEKDELFEGILGEFTRIHQLAKKIKGDVHVRNLQKLLGRLRCRTTPNQAIDLMMRINAAASVSTRKGKRMNVNSTGISRRREGMTRGSRRVPSGRPAKGNPPTTKPKHKLSQSVRNNKTNAKGHGH